MGIPTAYNDKRIDRVLWDKPDVLDEDGRLPLRDRFNSSKQIVNLDFDFTHRRFTVLYTTFDDVLS